MKSAQEIDIFLKKFWDNALVQFIIDPKFGNANSDFSKSVGFPVAFDWDYFIRPGISLEHPTPLKDRLIIGGRYDTTIYVDPIDNFVYLYDPNIGDAPIVLNSEIRLFVYFVTKVIIYNESPSLEELKNLLLYFKDIDYLAFEGENWWQEWIEIILE